MKQKVFSIISIIVLLVAALPAGFASAGQEPKLDPIRVDVSDRLKGLPAPEQLSPQEAVVASAAGSTIESQCGDTDKSLVITISSFDPAHPGSQDVVFWKETMSTSTGMATLWVAWDFLADTFETDVITCDQLAMLQASMDDVVATNVHYFGNYVERPAGNTNIDVMIYNIVDESYYDPDFPFFIAGFFWSSINETFNRNMIFIDSYDWENRVGPNGTHPYDYEATVAHELEHLIHNDQDFNEDSWVDEGMADLAEFLNGFGITASHVVYYLAYHRTPLTVWGGGLESYGASALFQLYLLEQFGEKVGSEWSNDWTLKLIQEQANGIDGVEAASGADFNELYDAWILANYIDDPSLVGAGGNPLGYGEIDLAPYYNQNYGYWSIARGIEQIYGADHHGNLPVSRYWGGYNSGTVEYPIGDAAPYAPIYGSYKGIQPVLNFNLRGALQSGVAPHTGMYEAASCGSNMLTDCMLALEAPVAGAALTFWTWFDIEEDWDYGFVEVSTDAGVTWMPIAGSITSLNENPNGSTAWANSLVGGLASTDAAITGNSGGWVEATFTLPAGSNLLRFAYYTDEATLGQGWFIDDVSVDGFSDGFELNADNWVLGGWERTTGLFDNDWLAAYINPVFTKGKFDFLDYGYVDTNTVVGSYEFEIGAFKADVKDEPAIVVISNRPGASPFSAGYRLLVSKGSASQILPSGSVSAAYADSAYLYDQGTGFFYLPLLLR